MTTKADGSTLSRHGDIIIVRRRHEEEEAHHGGVWKIAFADFMTAMMAFFLVMWLVNASEDATKAQIAQYFNPIKLNAATPPSTGLEIGEAQPRSGEPAASGGPTEVPGEAGGKPVGGAQEGGEDQALFRDPYAVLAEIAAQGGMGVQAGRDEFRTDGSGLPGLNGGEAYRDPFDPTSWQLAPNIVPNPEGKRDEAEADFATTVELTPAVANATAAEASQPSTQDAAASDIAPVQSAEMSEADAIEDELRRSVSQSAPAAVSGVDVTADEGGGITISLADSLTSGMFEIGSAKPSAETIRLVEEVARILKERKGDVVIRGHTDARPYSGEEFDNWRLSTARAHMAYYMLLRGGLDETRVSAIEGFADRRLKFPDDPDAAGNRRIEILLQEPAA